MDPQGQYGNHPFDTQQHHINESPHMFPNPDAQAQMSQHHLAYQQIHHQQQQLQLQLQSFWTKQCQDVDDVTDLRNHSLPLARIKKIMKADEDVRMISAETPMVFARACEMFILELTLRSWNHTEENKRRTLQRNDIAAAITRTDIFDFLVDVVPREDIKDGNFSAIPTRGGGQMAGTGNGDGPSYPYNYYMPPPVENLNTTTMMTMGRPMMDPTAVYGQQQNPYMTQPPPVWQNQTDEPPEDE